MSKKTNKQEKKKKKKKKKKKRETLFKIKWVHMYIWINKTGNLWVGAAYKLESLLKKTKTKTKKGRHERTKETKHEQTRERPV